MFKKVLNAGIVQVTAQMERNPIRPDEKLSVSSDHQYDVNEALYVDYVAIFPIADLIRGDEITIVPDGLLFFAPFAAFKDHLSKYFTERFRIRLVPTLSTLKLMTMS